MLEYDTTVRDRFWIKVDKTDTCWLWTACYNKNTGYGMLGVRNSTDMYIPRLAHRISWELHHGAIPNELCVLHKCDVRLCIRPDHLFLGSNKDNMEDCQRKGRIASGERNSSVFRPENLIKGENHNFAKISDYAVIDIRFSAKTKGGFVALANKYKIHTEQVYRIRKFIRRKNPAKSNSILDLWFLPPERSIVLKHAVTIPEAL